MKEAYEFRSRPVVIDPYDAIVQKAVSEMGSDLKDVDVIKLEPTCPGNRQAWVSNKDLIKGRPGKQRVIHLCLRKIQDRFKKLHGQPYTITDPNEKNRMTEIIKQYLKDVILPHETVHVHQEMQHGGEFGPSAEPEAERAERWKSMEQMGIVKKAMVDRVLLEYVKDADDTFMIKNFVRNIVQALRGGAMNMQQATERARKFVTDYGIPPPKRDFMRRELQTALGQPLPI